MEREVRRLLYFFAALFLALVGQLTYVQVYAAPELKTHAANTRSLEAEMRVERGLILSSDGVVLAQNREEGDYFFREYPLGELTSPWLGYNSLRYGRAGIERVFNEELAGRTEELAVRNLLDLVTGRPRRGADLHLTIDTQIQTAAASALGSRKGAVVALDPETGAIRGMVSWPRFDPNSLDEIWEELNADQDRPLLNRALNGLYPPGSAFKPVVAAGALQRNLAQAESRFVDEGEWLAGGFRVTNYGGNVFGEHDLVEAMARSVNTTFAKLAVQMGAAELASAARAFGWEEEPPLGLDVTPSAFPDPAGMDRAHVAQVGFGQGELLATPLQMALVAAAISNEGRVMAPYLVQEVRDYRGSVLRRARPEQWLTAVSAPVAADVRDMMVAVVRSGTGGAAALPGVTVAGKTGTAELGSGGDHAWFIGFAPAEDPQIAVAVIVENGGTGGAVAAPVAREVLAAALGR